MATTYQIAQLLDRDRMEQVVRKLLDEARSQGASAAEADASIVSGSSVTVRLGDVETVEHNLDRSIGLTVYAGKRKGSASTSDFSDKSIKEIVEAACAIARYTAEDEYSGLADADLMAYDFPDLDLCHPWDLPPEQAIELAKECEDAARGADPRISNSEGATVSSHRGIRVYGNSHGFVGGYPSTRHSLVCSVIAQEGDSMQRDYWYTTARTSERLEPAVEIGREAARRAARRLNGRQLATRQAPVIFSAEMASTLLSSFIGAIRGGALYRKSSFLLDSLGERVFPEFVTLREEPHVPLGLGSAPFDSEGVRTRASDVVRDGVVQHYVLDSYSARKLGMTTTGNAGGVHNLIIESGSDDFDGLLRRMGTGLLVTELMGQGVNRVTGDYSRGAAGFWVENGQIQYPVEEITVAGNLRRMFGGIQAVGNDVDTRRSILTGSILIDEMTIAGT